MTGESSEGRGMALDCWEGWRNRIQGKDREDAMMSLVGWREGGGRRGVVNPGILAGITIVDFVGAGLVADCRRRFQP